MAETTAGLDMALWISARGGMVIPAYIDKNCEKRPLLREWQNSGSRDEDVIREWYKIRPWANCGVLGGRDSFAVFDCDGRDAVDHFRTLCASVGGIDWESVLVYRTPGRKEADGSGGGLHAMWRWPSWLANLHKAEIRREGWRGGLEFRGQSTWTLLPCARRDGEYEIINAPDKIAEMPRELWLAFIEEAEQTVTLGHGSDLREVSPEVAFSQVWSDNRKTVVAGLAWHVMLRGMEEDECMELCKEFARDYCDPPLDRAIVERKVTYTAQRIEKIREKQARELGVMKSWVDSI